MKKSEYDIHKRVYNRCHDLINMPRIHKYGNGVALMTNIGIMNVSDMYGEHWSDVPIYIREKIMETVITLLKNNFVFPDLTGYNFIYDETADKLWIIDFEEVFELGASILTDDQQDHLKFVQTFCKTPINENTWNPYFL